MLRFTIRQHCYAVLVVIGLSVAFSVFIDAVESTNGSARATESSFGAGHSTILMPQALR